MKLPYNLKKPKKTYKLPKKYVEISGIWPLPGKNALAFVQDEAIQINHLDLASEKITSFVKHDSGDSEDIVILKNTAYILHAGGHPAIYEITNYKSKSAKCTHYDLHLKKHYDTEGLCYDAKKNRLLIACKGSPKKGDKRRKIFSFDLKSRLRSAAPLFTIDCRDFLHNSKLTFNPSGIAVHPKSKDIYVVGTRGAKMIVCYRPDGKFKGAWELDKKQFKQPEGITFMPSGKLIICSEGESTKKGQKAKIFTFPMKK